MAKLHTVTYSPEEVKLLVGVIPVTTFNKITVKYVRPRWKFYEGTKGELTRGKQISTFGIITLGLPRTSVINDYIFALTLIDGVIPIVVHDHQGISLHSMLQGTIENPPSVKYAKDVTDNQWTMKGRLVLNAIGGSHDILNQFQTVF